MNIAYGIAALAFVTISSGAHGQGMEQGPRFNNWSTACRLDPIDDRKTCIAINGEIVVTVTGKDYWTLTIGHEHYPRSLVHLRLDKQSARNTESPGWRGRAADPILYDLRSAEQAVIRYTRFAGQRVITREIDTSGAGEMLDFLIKNITPN